MKDQIASWLRDDPLRSVTSKKNCESLNPAEFTRELFSRVQGARFEPRIAESIVERLALYPEKIDFDQVVQQAKRPRRILALGSLGPLVFFALHLNCHANLVFLQKYLERERLKKISLVNGLEGYFVWSGGVAGPRAIRVIERENLAPWASWGFWAGSAPFSKEILQIFPLKKPIRLARYAVENAITDFAKSSHSKWFSISEIQQAIDFGVSGRQLSRILGAHPNLRRSGELKGARYTYVT
jgi:hypothetical protein